MSDMSCSFRMTRTVTNMDTQLLKDRIDGLIRSTNYRGNLEICFPIADRYVDIYTTNRIQTWRLTTWIRWLFYLSFLWIFSWPLLYFTTKRWAVVRAEWPFALTDARGGKTYTTVSEEEWVSKFGPAIRQLAVDRFKGETGDDHLSQTLVRVERDGAAAPPIDLGRTINSAVTAWRGGINAQSVLRMGATSDPVGWGFDC